MIKRIFQPPGSSLCGQTCVAMVAGVTLEESIAAFGGKRGGTRTRDIVGALRKLGIKCGDRLERINGPLPNACIVKLRFAWSKQTHWTLWYMGRFYDPDEEGNTALNDTKTQYPEGVRPTSYLPIFSMEVGWM